MGERSFISRAVHLRAVPVDLAAFVAIAIAIVVSHVDIVRHGMCFNDTAWYFHFGNRTLNGDVPYRDYVFQVGPLPIYVDAAFQKLFGPTYLASLYAGIFCKIVRVFVVWLVARRLGGWQAAGLLAVFCAIDGSLGWIHNWSTPYSQLFFTLSGLYFVLASRAEGRRAYLHLALAGLCAGLVVSARQSTTVMIALVLVPATLIMLYRREYFTPKRFVALWAGFVAAFIVVFGAMAVAGAFGPSIQQMFLDAPQKKSVQGLDAVLDPISGGAMVLYGRSWWGGLLSFIALPVVVVAGAIYAMSRMQAITLRTVALLAMPVAIVVGMFSRFGSLSFYSDVPRTLLAVTTAIAVWFPDRMRRWFGIEPVVAIGLGALPLASDWANELSFPGRGWGDSPALLVGGILLVLASARLARRTKTWLCAAFAAAGLLHFGLYLHADTNPFTKNTATDGTLADNRYSYRGSAMRGIRINQARKRILDWLTGYVKPGDTCFMYGNLVAVYDLLGCKNPTRIDTTITDFISADDAREAMAVLQAHPPNFLITQEWSFTNPSLEVELEGRVKYFSPLNSDAARVLHVSLRAMLGGYESLGLISEVIGPELETQIGMSWDSVSGTRLYRRKR